MKLAGTLFVFNGIKYDYNFKESIKCLLEFCDHVYVVDAGSEDGTVEEILSLKTDNLTFIQRDKEEWDSQIGREKLNYFTNIAIKKAQEDGYEWQFNLQADEIVHEKSYKFIRKAISESENGFMVSRINLWKSPYFQLVVPQNRKPCSTEIVRLAKTEYRSYDDAESLAVPNVSIKFIHDIVIYHMGFVRDRKIMKDKAIHIQRDIFKVDYDKKLDGIDYFEPDRWFNPKEDLRPIDEPLPALIKDWAKKRVYK
jgi:glycosyltransferase involved in cell wall biosynthesis